MLAVARGHPLHLHAEGLRGTGKTTVIRAAARLLPSILRLRDCPYNCDPARPHCPLHRELGAAELQRLGSEEIRAPFLEISPSAKIGTVVGSIDLARLTDPGRPQAALLPGTLARAHRGVVFVDEVNRLADTSPELADALLDVMGTKPGRLQIEETGLPPVVLPCRATVWAASNPDEEPGPLADIRRQLADRFDLGVAMRRPAEAPAVLAVLCRDDLAGESSLAAAPAEWAAAALAAPSDATAGLGRELQALAAQAAPRLPQSLQEQLARIYCEFQVESLRAVQAWQTAARLLALRAGHAAVEPEDCRRAAPLVLRHRLESEELARLLEQLEPRPPREAAALAASAAPVQAPSPAPGPELPAAAADAAPRPHWWQRLVAGRGAGPGGLPAGPARFPDPCTLPAITPREPARFLTDLPPGELLTPAHPEGR